MRLCPDMKPPDGAVDFLCLPISGRNPATSEFRFVVELQNPTLQRPLQPCAAIPTLEIWDHFAPKFRVEPIECSDALGVPLGIAEAASVYLDSITLRHNLTSLGALIDAAHSLANGFLTSSDSEVAFTGSHPIMRTTGQPNFLLDTIGPRIRALGGRFRAETRRIAGSSARRNFLMPAIHEGGSDDK